MYFQHYIEKNLRKINKRTFILSKIEVEMLCFKTENVIASIIYGGVSKKGGPNFTLLIHAKIVYNSTNNSAAPSRFKWNPTSMTLDTSGTHYVVTVTPKLPPQCHNGRHM